jgi:hypothetical protein
MKNTAKFTIKTKKEIFNRDSWRCIFCLSEAIDRHHRYFWMERDYSDNRNKLNAWVLVCRNCHNECHSCSIWEWKRQLAINYLSWK